MLEIGLWKLVLRCINVEFEKLLYLYYVILVGKKIN